MDSDNAFKGHEFYDEESVFDYYSQHRKSRTNPNDLIEKPAFLEMLDGVDGEVLDLGCGYGDIAETLLDRGISKYTGIDASTKMIAQGRNQLSGDQIEWVIAALEDHDYGIDRYDWVISRLAFHYIEDMDGLLDRLHTALKPGGRLVFSVEHPVLTSSMDLPRAPGPKTDWTVDQYFQEAPRVQAWMGSRIIKYHRSLESWWKILTTAGFRIELINEGRPRPEHFRDPEEFARRMRIPMFLLFRATRNG